VSELGRGEFLRGGVAAISALSMFGTSEAWAAAAKPPQGDIAILNFALSLEYLQDAFYTEAERKGALRGEAATLARVVGAVERAHVKALRRALGKSALKRPFFDFRGVTEDQAAFVRTAVTFEDLAVAAYKGQAHRIRSPEILATAAGIHSVEARHAAWIRYLADDQPAQAAFDEPITQAETAAEVAATKFIVDAPRTRSQRRPPFTG
jgi:rubrerythrin